MTKGVPIRTWRPILCLLAAASLTWAVAAAVPAAAQDGTDAAATDRHPAPPEPSAGVSAPSSPASNGAAAVDQAPASKPSSGEAAPSAVTAPSAVSTPSSPASNGAAAVDQAPASKPSTGEDAPPAASAPSAAGAPSATGAPSAVGAPSGPGSRDKAVANLTSALSQWTNQLDTQELAIREKTTTDEQLRAVPDRLERVREAIVRQREQVKPILQGLKERLAKLGAAPADGAPKESPEIAAERQRLEAKIADIDGKLKQADILSVRIDQMIEAANEQRRDRFAESLFQPVPNLYTQVLPAAFESLPGHLRQRTGTLLSWFGRVWDRGVVLFALMFAVPIAVGFGVPLFSRHLATDRAAMGDAPTLQQRGIEAFKSSLLACLPLWAAMAAFYLLSIVTGLAVPGLDGLLLNAVMAAAWAVLLIALVRQSLVPDNEAWKVVPLTGPTAWRLSILLWVMVAAWLCEHLLSLADSIVFTPFPILTLRSALFAVVLGLLLAGLLWAIQRGTVTRQEVFSGWRGWLFSFASVVAIVTLLAAALGYEELGLFIGTHVVSTAGVLWIMFMLHLEAESLSSVSVISGRAVDDDPQEKQDMGAPSLLTIRVIVSLLLDVVIIAVGVTILLLMWRFDWVEVRGWIQAAFIGFQFGNLRISLQSILIALCIFMLGLLLTRFVQRWLTGRVFAGRRSASGLNDSVRIGIGYVGFVLAALAGISYLGVDFSNLAIIAGALSVGIGFGLQSIFNNFVSGLILLVERPIKIGDYIQVGGHEGTVKMISVRSTEIETIHRQSVIVPNATLITDPVVNWMHLDKTCRLDIPIGVAYGTDVELLRSTLLRVGTAYREVLRSPPPVVHFAGFGDSSLDFELRVFLRDVRNRIVSSSELRFEMLKALDEAGIAIPFPQRDVHVRDGRAPEEAV